MIDLETQILIRTEAAKMAVSLCTPHHTTREITIKASEIERYIKWGLNENQDKTEGY